MSKKSVIPEAALNQHIAVLGKTGSGKTFAIKGVVEHMLDQKRQVCVLDPTGAWYGLRLGVVSPLPPFKQRLRPYGEKLKTAMEMAGVKP